MRRNLVLALGCEPRPLRHLHYSQAKALERRGFVRIEIAVIGHPVDVYLGSANVYLTDAGRAVARAIEQVDRWGIPQ
jgi:hypothetical protein